MKQIVKYFILVLCIISFGCKSTKVIRNHTSIENFSLEPDDKNRIKVYMNDGSLYILENWNNNDNADVLNGTGILYNANRNLQWFVNKEGGKTSRQNFNDICKEDISIVETNELTGNQGNMFGITIPGVSLSIISLYCIANPKACFGSCPTFYTKTDKNWKLTAEGFSSSILPSFEKRDIDKLYLAETENNRLHVRLTNEALETHAIKYANILAFPKKQEQQIFCTVNNNFYSVKNITPPQKCTDSEGSCLDAVLEMDKKERFSLCNSKNLAKKEEIFISFNSKNGSQPCLIINSRQTLLTTYLFYQTMAFSGNYYAAFAAEVENGNTWLKNRFFNTWEKLGGIEVYLKREGGGWKKLEEIKEMGPIASDFHIIKLPNYSSEKIDIKLKMTQGLWRINYLALATTFKKETPFVLYPESILAENLDNTNQFKLLTDSCKYLYTYPGDKFLLEYRLPENIDYEFFLDTKGYYLEWMRNEWKQEEDLRKIKLLFAFPGIYFRKMAKEFKKVEPSMEESFWNSRYETSMNKANTPSE